MTYVRHAFTAVVLAAVFASHFFRGDPQRGPDPVTAMRMASGLPIAEPSGFAAVVKPGAPSVSPLAEAMRGIGALDNWMTLLWLGAILLAFARLAWRIVNYGRLAVRAFGFAGSAAQKLFGATLAPRPANFTAQAAPAPKPRREALPSRPAAQFPTRAKFFGG